MKLTTHLHQVRGQECVELYLHSPNTTSWRGAWLSTGTKVVLTELEKVSENISFPSFAPGSLLVPFEY
jgi:hypothetical protein